MPNKYVEFRYEYEYDVVLIDRIVNIGDVSQPYDNLEDQSESRILHVFARNISQYDLYNPGLYLLHQDYESRTKGSKGDNFRLLISQPLNSDGLTAKRQPFVSVLFTPLTTAQLDWRNCLYFDSYNGTKDNPILFTIDAGGITLKNNLPCLEIDSEVGFWLRVQNTLLQKISAEKDNENKDIEDGKWGFALKFTGELHGQ